MIYMVCYDIAAPKRLRRTAKILENFGLRVQKSFFQCEIEKERMEAMREQILEVIDTDKDYLFIYPLCENCSHRAQTDGRGELIRLAAYEII